MVAVASLLPDLIDKPIGRLVLRERFETGRLFGHTLLLHVLLFCVLFFVRGRLKRTLVLVPVSSVIHLALDGAFLDPEVFWWPLFGARFPADPVPGGTFAFLYPANHPGAWWQEAVGLAVLAWLFASHRMLSRDGVRSFLRTGMLEGSS